MSGNTARVTPREPARRSGGAPWIWIAVAFVGGLLAMAWILTNGTRLWSGAEEGAPVAAAADAPPPAATPELARLAGSVDPVSGRVVDPAARDALSAASPAMGELQRQVGALEGRLATVRTAADGAAANARRAEAILLAFAARRTLDRGVPLGFLQAQLRQRFPGQPRAVDTIVDAAANPVTVESLRAALPELAVRREDGLGGLFTALRRDGEPLIHRVRPGERSRDASELLGEAESALARGNVEAALAAVGATRSSPERIQWVRAAQNYVAAHQALDVIETAAILQGVGSQGAPAE